MSGNNRSGRGAGGFAGLGSGRKEFETQPGSKQYLEDKSENDATTPPATAPISTTPNVSSAADATSLDPDSRATIDDEQPHHADTVPSNTISLTLPEPKDRAPKRVTHVTISPQVLRTTIEALDVIAANVGLSRVDLIDTILCDYVAQVQAARPELMVKKKRKST